MTIMTFLHSFSCRISVRDATSIIVGQGNAVQHCVTTTQAQRHHVCQSHRCRSWNAAMNRAILMATAASGPIRGTRKLGEHESFRSCPTYRAWSGSWARIWTESIYIKSIPSSISTSVHQHLPFSPIAACLHHQVMAAVSDRGQGGVKVFWPEALRAREGTSCSESPVTQVLTPLCLSPVRVQQHQSLLRPNYREHEPAPAPSQRPWSTARATWGHVDRIV